MIVTPQDASTQAQNRALEATKWSYLRPSTQTSNFSRLPPEVVYEAENNSEVAKAEKWRFSSRVWQDLNLVLADKQREKHRS